LTRRRFSRPETPSLETTGGRAAMSDLTGLAEHVEQLAGASVLCIGDLMLDRFIYGEVSRISPEAPIPVMRVESELAMPGGAGNVARNLISLGASCTFLSLLGRDTVGRELAAMIGAEPRIEAYLLTDPERVSTIKSRYLAAGQHLLRTDHETPQPVSSAIAEDLQRAAVDAIKEHQAVVLSDYGKGALTATLIEAVIVEARAVNVPVIVDPKGDDFSCYRGASVISPNCSELVAATRQAAGDDDEVVAAARALIANCGIDTVLATRGSRGMSLVGADEAVHLPARGQDVFDVSGAGDTVVATLAAALGCGLPAAEAASLANVAAGIVVGKVGTAVVTAGDLEAALRHGDVLDSESKVLAADRADERIAGWRQQGQRIGFTNGCFDLLHPGHVSLMRQAQASCDRLIVGLNSDASVARLKGPDRPVQGEAARALVLASLEDVDLVVVFTDDTPLPLIERFRPDVLVKGADYALDEVVGAELVRRWGGRVVLANLEPGHSTSGTIERLARGA